MDMTDLRINAKEEDALNRKGTLDTVLSARESVTGF